MNLDHLSDVTRQIAESTDDEARIERILADRYIAYTRANDAVAKLEWLLRSPKKMRMPNLLIVGPTNSGKTMITEKFRRMHPPTMSLDGRADIVPVLRVQMPSAADPLRFYHVVLESLGAPGVAAAKWQRLVQKESQAIQLLRATGVRVLIIDEIHNALAGPTNKLSEMLNLLRYLGNELQIPLVAVGVKEALQVIHSDDQLANRFEPFPLPRWQDDDELRSLLAAFERALPLRRPSGLANPVMTRRLIALSEGILGEIVTLIVRAAEMAVRTGNERIDVGLFERIDFMPPSARRASAVAMRVD
ncbi:TniB family NTP-binding protein (plasmid) [Azospirillum sp. A26]